ncbi:MAG: TIGR04282 family arsenosugar biosynthesis glycosyltransferase [Elusimicrobiota bacterium]
MPRDAVILFMKAPVAGHCKTRLTPPLTPRQAAGLYRAFCLDIVRSLSRLPADLWIAYQARDPFPTPRWAAPGARFFRQEGADLGERLRRAFQTVFAMGYERAAALGTDAPTLPPARVRRAFRELRKAEAVFGPAEDGGYYLVGLSRPMPELFRNIPWSTGDVLSETRRLLVRRRVKAAFLAPHYDVDSQSELLRLDRDAALKSRRLLCPRTRRFLRGLKLKSPS